MRSWTVFWVAVGLGLAVSSAEAQAVFHPPHGLGLGGFMPGVDTCSRHAKASDDSDICVMNDGDGNLLVASGVGKDGLYHEMERRSYIDNLACNVSEVNFYVTPNANQVHTASMTYRHRVCTTPGPDGKQHALSEEITDIDANATVDYQLWYTRPYDAVSPTFVSREIVAGGQSTYQKWQLDPRSPTAGLIFAEDIRQFIHFSDTYFLRTDGDFSDGIPQFRTQLNAPQVSQHTKYAFLLESIALESCVLADSVRGTPGPYMAFMAFCVGGQAAAVWIAGIPDSPAPASGDSSGGGGSTAAPSSSESSGGNGDPLACYQPTTSKNGNVSNCGGGK